MDYLNLISVPAIAAAVYFIIEIIKKCVGEKETFYKAKEPTEGINYHSEESKKLFLESLQNNLAREYSSILPIKNKFLKNYYNILKKYLNKIIWINYSDK